jgi:hypothetical protein
MAVIVKVSIQLSAFSSQLYKLQQLSLLQKCLSTEILLIYPRESGGTGFRACADKGLNLSDIMLIFFIKSSLEPEGR